VYALFCLRGPPLQVTGRFAGCGAALCSGEGLFLTKIVLDPEKRGAGPGMFYAGGFGSITVRYFCFCLRLFLLVYLVLYDVYCPTVSLSVHSLLTVPPLVGRAFFTSRTFLATHPTCHSFSDAWAYYPWSEPQVPLL